MINGAVLFFLLQINVDTKIPAWGVALSVLLWLGQLIWQLASSHFMHKATKEKFKVERDAINEKFAAENKATREKFEAINKYNETTLIQLHKEMEHLRNRNRMDIETVKKDTEEKIHELKSVFKDYTLEVKELRDVLMGLSKSVDLLTLKDMRGGRNKNGG